MIDDYYLCPASVECFAHNGNLIADIPHEDILKALHATPAGLIEQPAIDRTYPPGHPNRQCEILIDIHDWFRCNSKETIIEKLTEALKNHEQSTPTNPEH